MQKILLLSLGLIAFILIDQGACRYVDKKAKDNLLLTKTGAVFATSGFTKDGQFDCVVYRDYFPYEYATCMYGHPFTSPKVVDFMYMPPRSALYVLFFGKSHLSTFAGDNALVTYKEVGANQLDKE